MQEEWFRSVSIIFLGSTANASPGKLRLLSGSSSRNPGRLTSHRVPRDRAGMEPEERDRVSGLLRDADPTGEARRLGRYPRCGMPCSRSLELRSRPTRLTMSAGGWADEGDAALR